ncbi:MAG TPA: prolipoprotein diacylglyceryl transferase family protein [Chloroflexota bacterium]
MIVIPFDPLVVHVGPWAVRLFGVLAVAGLGAASWFTLRQLDDNDRRRALRAIAWAIPVGVLSARAADILTWWDYYLLHLQDLPRLSPDGLLLWGGLVGGGLVASAALRHDPARRARIFNAAAPGVALGIAIGRFGQLLDGFGQGLPSSLVWATQYSSRLMATPDFGVPRHPVQIYDGLIALGLYFALRQLRPEWRAATFLIAYAAAGLALAPLKIEPPFLFGLRIEQLLAAATLGTGVTLVRQTGRRAEARRVSQAVA